jgi:LacI family transcriptional regulator
MVCNVRLCNDAQANRQGLGTMRVTAQEVARAARVSVSTVSRALSHSEVVSAETRSRVIAAAEDLGYVRPVTQQRGRRQRVGTVGLVVPDLANPFFATIAKAVQARARVRRYAVLVADSDEDPVLELEIAEEFGDQVDGVIMCSPRSPAELVAEYARTTKTVVMNRNVAGVPSVTVAENESVAKVVAHLEALGHQQIAYVGGPVWSNSERARAAAVADTAGRESVIEHIGNFQPFAAGGFAAADLVLSTGATAAIAFNDLVALGLVARLRDRGLSVPADLSVTGFDDVLYADSVSPPLTTISMPLIRLGTQAFEVLLGYLESGVAPESPTPQAAQLVVRGSTAIPRVPKGT